MLARVSVLSAIGGLALIAPGSAVAKGPNFASICAASGCTTLRGEAAVQPLISWWYRPFSHRSAPAPFYSIKLRDPSGIRWSLLYVPARRAMRIWQSRVPPYNESIGPYWRTVPGAAVPAIDQLMHKVTPYAAPRRWHR